MIDILIVGAGPAGISAALYATHQKLKTLVVSQILSPQEPEVSFDIFNFPKLVLEFKQALLAHKEYLEFMDNQEVVRLDHNIVSFSIETKTGILHYARSIILASGAKNNEGNASFEQITVKDPHSKIKIDGDFATNVPGLFAAGSVTNGKAFGSAVAAASGIIAAGNAASYLKMRQ